MDWTVWKFPLPIDRDDFEIAMPSSVTMTLQDQNGVPCLWCSVMPDGDSYPHRFVWVGTGKKIPDSVRCIGVDYVGTVQLFDGSLVLHLFRVNS